MKKIQLNQHEIEVPAQEPVLAIDEPTVVAPKKPLITQKGTAMKSATQKIPAILYSLLAIAAVAGIGTGFGISRLNAKTPSIEVQNMTVGSPTDQINVDDVFGSPNEEIFKDSAEGVVVEGGIGGEGSHYLARPGGVSQNVYMTSSSVDLEKFVGTKVKVWGETFSAQKAGWLMDVGRVKVLELDVAVPTEEEE